MAPFRVTLLIVIDAFPVAVRPVTVAVAEKLIDPAPASMVSWPAVMVAAVAVSLPPCVERLFLIVSEPPASLRETVRGVVTLVVNWLRSTVLLPWLVLMIVSDLTAEARIPVWTGEPLTTTFLPLTPTVMASLALLDDGKRAAVEEGGDRRSEADFKSFESKLRKFRARPLLAILCACGPFAT